MQSRPATRPHLKLRKGHSVLPNFLIIGAPRCGTTYLLTHLSQHPDVFMARFGEKYATGDIHFFDMENPAGAANYAKGLEWYEAFFDEAITQTAIGEKTATYLSDPRAPDAIRETLGDEVRFIAILRNPIERLMSHYWHVKSELPANKDLLSVLNSEMAKQHTVFESGLYWTNLRRYLDKFGSDQVLVVLYDELHSNSLAMLRSVYSFLHVRPDFVPEGYDRRVNVSVRRGLPYHLSCAALAVRNRAPRLFSAARRLPGAGIVKHYIAKSRGSDTTVNQDKTRDYRTTEANPPVPIAIRRALSDRYREDLAGLGRHIGVDLVAKWLD